MRNGPATLTEPKFSMGRIVGTPGAMAALEAAGRDPMYLLRRHECGDWGDVCAEDAQSNDESVGAGLRLLSAYTLPDGVKVWIITEADRSSTCILLPDEY